MPELRDLRCLIVVYETEGFARAARALNLTQSSVSARILKLEKELDGLLFVRMHRSIVPTVRGERAYRYAKDVIGRVDEGSKRIRDSEAA